jgi:transposase InsO family protein
MFYQRRSRLQSVHGVSLRGASPPRAFMHPSELSKEARQRLRWMDFRTAHGRNVSLTCRHFGISRDTFYRWWRRYDPLDIATLETKSRAPKTRRTPTTSPETVGLVLRLRDSNPEWSKYKLSVVAARDHGVQVSPSSVGRILKRYGRVNDRRSAKRRKAARNTRTRRPKELVAAHPGDLVQIDTKHLYLADLKRCFQFVAVDVATRVKVTEVYKTASSRSAARFLATVRARLPFDVACVQTDNGSEYLGEFDRACTEAGIAHFFSYPHCPKHNAYVERQIQTEIEEFHSLIDPVLGVEELNDLLVAWDRFYNEVRPHQGLRYLTPMAYYRSIEATRAEDPGNQ